MDNHVENKKSLILLGAGGHCRSCIDVIEQQGIMEIVGVIDRQERIGEQILGYQIIGSDDDLHALARLNSHAFITIGQLRTAERRIELFEMISRNKFDIPAIISPFAYVSRHAKIGKGTIIMHGAIVNAGAEIGDNCIINSRALIEHDSVVEDHCHISTGAIVNGGSRVGKRSFIGSGAVCRHAVEIASDSFMKANTLIV